MGEVMLADEARSEIEDEQDRIWTLFALFIRMSAWLYAQAAEGRTEPPTFDGGETLSRWLEENGLASSYRRMAGSLILELNESREQSDNLDDFFHATVASFPALSIKAIQDILALNGDAAFRFFAYLLLSSNPPRRGHR